MASHLRAEDQALRPAPGSMPAILEEPRRRCGLGRDRRFTGSRGIAGGGLGGNFRRAVRPGGARANGCRGSGHCPRRGAKAYRGTARTVKRNRVFRGFGSPRLHHCGGRIGGPPRGLPLSRGCPETGIRHEVYQPIRRPAVDPQGPGSKGDSVVSQKIAATGRRAAALRERVYVKSAPARVAHRRVAVGGAQERYWQDHSW